MDEAFADILAAQQADKGLGGIFKPLDNVFSHFDLALRGEAREFSFRLCGFIKEIRHDEAFNLEALCDEQSGNAARPVGGGIRIIL